MRVLVEGVVRGKIIKYFDNENFFEVEIKQIHEEVDKDDLSIKGYFNTLKRVFLSFVKEAGEATTEMTISIKKEKDVYTFVDMVSSFVPIEEDVKQEILETLDIQKRIEIVLTCLQNEIKIIKVQKRLANKMKKSVDESQKEFYLREQLKFIQEELGEDDEEAKIIKQYEDKIKKLKLPSEAKKKAKHITIK